MFSARPVTQEDREAAAAKATKQRKTPSLMHRACFFIGPSPMKDVACNFMGFIWVEKGVGHFLRKKNWQKQ